MIRLPKIRTEKFNIILYNFAYFIKSLSLNNKERPKIF